MSNFKLCTNYKPIINQLALLFVYLVKLLDRRYIIGVSNSQRAVKALR